MNVLEALITVIPMQHATTLKVGLLALATLDTKVVGFPAWVSSPDIYFLLHKSYMWQSCVEIKGYFVTYFNRFATFEAPYR